MKTPPIELSLIWTLIYFVILVPKLVSGLWFNLVYLTVILPIIMKIFTMKVITSKMMHIDWAYLIPVIIIFTGLLFSIPIKWITENDPEKKNKIKSTFMILSFVFFAFMSVGLFINPYSNE